MRWSTAFATLAMIGALSVSSYSQCRTMGPICRLATVRQPLQACVNRPILCSPLTVLFRIEVRNAPPSAPAVMVIGVTPFPNPLPIPNPPACNAVCSLTIAPLATLPTATDATGTGHFDFVMPCIPSAIGSSVYTYWAIAAQRAGGPCIQFSDTMQVTFQ